MSTEQEVPLPPIIGDGDAGGTITLATGDADTDADGTTLPEGIGEGTRNSSGGAGGYAEMRENKNKLSRATKTSSDFLIIVFTFS